MLHHFKIMLRQFTKQKLYTFITISCLAIGITLAILTTSYSIYELNYDRFVHNEKKAIFRLSQINASDEKTPIIREDIIDEIGKSIAEIEGVCRINQAYPGIRYQQKSFKLDHLITADPQFFDFFPLNTIYGDLETSLLDPKSILVTESLANKIAGKTDILGEVVTLGRNFDYKVTAIIEDWQKNSHLEVEAIIPNEESPFGYTMSGGRKSEKNSFYFRLYETYFMISKNADLANVEQKINQVAPILWGGKMQYEISYSLTPLQDIYMTAETGGVSSRQGNVKKIYLLIVISFVILLIAGINFVNLTTARASKRAGEIGIKKTVGASRAMLVRQFMVESVSITIMATGIAFCLAELLMPITRRLLLVDFSLYSFYDFPGNLFFIVGILLTSFLAGFYPALYLSRFQPITVLRDKTSQNPQKNFISRGLVVLQFVISVIFIIEAIVIYRQLSYVNHIDLGYNKQHLLHLNYDITNRNYQLFKDRLLQNTNIKAVTFTRSVPGEIRYTLSRGNQSMKGMDISQDFIETFKMKLIGGRIPLPGDINKVCLVNESAFQMLDDEIALGRELFGKEIIGVVEDFHFASLHSQVQPLYMPYMNKHFEDVTVRLNSERINETIQYIRDVWNELYPTSLFDFYFYDEKIDSQYRAEYRLGELIAYITIAAILMSCFGLIGLAIFTAENSTKEIGIRKIFGASIRRILRLFIKNFVYLVLIANLLAWPIAWFAMNSWLQNFAYRTEVNLWIFLTGGLLTVLVVILTVAICTLKAALANPVRSLRYD